MLKNYRNTIINNLKNTMNNYSYKLTKTIELEHNSENCVFKKNETNIIIFTFSYTEENDKIKHTSENHYLNNGFYRKEINGYNGYYGIIHEADKEWEKFSYLLNNTTLIMTIAKLTTSKIPMKDLVKNYCKS